MTEPVQQELFKRRGRRPASVLPDPLEVQIHISLIAYLKLACRPGITYWHAANGELRDKRSGAKLKAMGVLPGVADLEFVFPAPHPNLYLELKARGRGLTDDQKVFRNRMRAAGHFYEWTDSIDDAMRILRQYKVVRA